MNLASFYRPSFYQKYTFERGGDGKMRVTINTRSTVENISDSPTPYQSWLQIEPGSNPQLDSVTVIHGANVIGGPSAFTESPTRKHILEAKSDEIEMQPGETVSVEWRYTIDAEEKGSDTLSFGIPTGHVVIEVDAPPDLEVVVDPIRPATSQTGNKWEFARRFETEQHVPVRWWLREDV